MPPWAQGGAIGAYVMGVLLLVTGAALLINKQVRLLSLVTGAWFVFSVFVFHLQHASSVWSNGNDRTRALETLCIRSWTVGAGGDVVGGRVRWDERGCESQVDLG